MLAVAVDEQHRAQPRVVETGQQRRLFAEIARQRHHLDVECDGRQRVGDRQRVVAAAVIDINHFAGERVIGGERARDLGKLGVQALQAKPLRCAAARRWKDRAQRLTGHRGAPWPRFRAPAQPIQAHLPC